MPSYTFKDKNTGEEFDIQMSMSEHTDFIKENPHLTQIIRSVNVVDPVGIGVTRPPTEFLKNVVGRAKEVPGASTSALEKRWNIPREW